jgi:diguanylate cyclase
LINQIGAWALEQACVRSAAWNAERGAKNPLSVSVNLSVRQLTDPAFPAALGEILSASGAVPDTLWLEITEASVMVDTEAAAETLRALRGHGVHLSIDDFGTGYSSLSHLKRLPVESLKIDRSFVAGLGDNPDDTAIVAACVGLAHALGLAVVAEGVEKRGAARGAAGPRLRDGSGLPLRRAAFGGRARRSRRPGVRALGLGADGVGDGTRQYDHTQWSSCLM